MSFHIHKIIFALIGFSAVCLAQLPYAPWIKLSSDAPDEIGVRTYPVPLKSEVDIPPYLGAVLTSVSASVYNTIKHSTEVLPFVILVTADTPDKVIEFYKTVLTPEEGWQYTDEYKGFVRGEIISASTGFIPGVGIRKENGDDFDLVYVDENLKEKLKTRIKIRSKT